MRIHIVLTMFLILGLMAVDYKSAAAQRRGQRGPDNAPKVGDTAPAFKLGSADGKSETDFASFRGVRPVVLFFGSYS